MDQQCRRADNNLAPISPRLHYSITLAQAPEAPIKALLPAEVKRYRNRPIAPSVPNFSPLAAQLSRPQVFAERIRPIRAKQSKG
jgi:hypothetical protein